MNPYKVTGIAVLSALCFTVTISRPVLAVEIFEIEPNNEIGEAQNIELPCTIKGSHSEYAEFDHYSLTLTQPGTSLYLALSAEGEIDPKIALLEEDGDILTESNFFKVNGTEYLTSLLLDPGTYFIRVHRSFNRKEADIPYTLTVNRPPDVSQDDVRLALNKALDYIVSQQQEDGGFTSKLGVAAMPGFAIQALLGAECVERDDWESIYRAIDFVKEKYKNPEDYPEGRPRDMNGGGIFYHKGLYEHAICLTALIEAYALGVEEDLPIIIRNGVDFLNRAQLTQERPATLGGPIPLDSKYYGGWRYSANATDADLSVSGWQIITLTAARIAGFDVSRERLDVALDFIRRCYRTDLGEFAYMPDGAVATGRNAMGALSIQLLGASEDSLVAKGLRTILNRGPAWNGEPNGVYPFYYWYYGSRSAYLAGGEIWSEWKKAMCGMLVRHQNKNGSWDLAFNEGSKLDPVYGATLGALILELCCGNPPIYLRTDKAPDRPKPPPRAEMNISIEYPGSTSRVQGDVEIVAVPVVPERVTVERVVFYVDGESVGERTEPPWTFMADTGPGVQSREFKVVGTSDQGLEATASVVTAEGQNRVSVRIIRPRAGKVFGVNEILVQASGHADSPLDTVLVEVDGEVILAKKEQPFSVEYDFGTLGGKTIVATAVNALGKRATDTVTFPEAPPVEVDFTATVLDQENMYILELTKDDFLVEEDGIPQEIIRFSRELTPVSMTILLDTSGSIRRHMRAVQDAAIRFVSQIRPVDRVAIIAFSDNARVIQRFTSDIGTLTTAIRKTQAKGGTSLYDAIVTGCFQLRAEKGRTAIILLTDGKDENKNSTGPGSKATFDEALEKAKETGVTIYSLGLGKGVAKEVLENIAQPTGGRAYFPPTVDDLAEVYELVSKELQSQYSIGYSSTNRMKDRAWRTLDVTVPGTNYTVRSKDGFFAK